MRDVARVAGVSVTTVSRVINGVGYVGADTRRAVQEAIESLGFVPSASARGLAARQTGMVGLCLPDAGPASASHRAAHIGGRVEIVADPAEPSALSWASLLFGEVIRGAELAAWRAGLALTVAVARPPEVAARARELAGRVDGLIVVAETLSDELIRHVAHRVPVVLLSGRRPAGGYDRVGVDNVAGVRALVDHLVRDHGIRDLQYVAAQEGAADDAERFHGFRLALATAGIAAPEHPILRGDFSRQTARRLARALADRRRTGGPALPGALVCANDETALGFMDVLTTQGYDVPGDVAVTGFDGIDGARTSYPRLTTVEQPMADLGRLAVDVVQARITRPGLPRQNLIVPVRVLLRESCGVH